MQFETSCEVCMEGFTSANFVAMSDDCNHFMHKTCAANYILKDFKLDERNQIKCPGDGNTCSQIVKKKTVKQVLNPAQMKEYEELCRQRMMGLFKDFKQCPKCKEIW